MKKWFHLTCIALLIALTAVACGGAPTPAPTPPEVPPVQEQDPEVVPDPTPEPKPFIRLRSGQAASLVIGQDDFVSDSEIAAEKRFLGAYGHPLVVDGVLYLPDFGAGRVMGYLQMPTDNGAAADFVLGKSDFDDAVDGPSSTVMSGPQTVFTEGENLFVLDYDHSRIVRYDGFPTTSGAAAVLAIGQPDLNTGVEGCSATSLNNPEGATIAAGRLIVADTANERVLIWNEVPTEFGVQADIVLGQTSMDDCISPAGPSERALGEPTDVWSDGTRLLVVDSDHERVLLWNEFPTTNNAPADIVLGQPNMTSGDDGDGANEFSLPYFLASNGTQIAVADTNNNRVLIWNEFPTENGVPADVVLGQSDFGRSDRNGGVIGGPTSTGFYDPTGVMFYEDLLFVSDNENERYLVFEGL